MNKLKSPNELSCTLIISWAWLPRCGKEPTQAKRRPGLDLWPREDPPEKWNATHSFLLRKFMDGGEWQVTIHRVTKKWT